MLFVSPGPSLSTPASGEGTRLKHLSRGLAERGWDELALVPGDVTDHPEWVRQVYRYDQWGMPFLLDLNPSFLSTLARVLRNEDVDVIFGRRPLGVVGRTRFGRNAALTDDECDTSIDGLIYCRRESDLMASTAGPPSVLFVSSKPSLVQPASGEGTRLHHLSQGLADDCDWTVYALVPAATDEEVPWAEQTYTFEQWSLPFLTDLNPSFVRALVRVVRDREPDVIHLSMGVCAAKAVTSLVGTETTVTYAAQNVEAEHARDFVDPDLPVHKRLLGPRLIPLIERATVACADLVTTVSEKDREAFIERYGVRSDRIRAIPTGTQSVDETELEDRNAVRERLGLDPDVPVAVFHGSYAHPPNQEAFELIVDEIVPALRERGVELQFLLVGKGVPDGDTEGVVVAGFVDDLFSVLHATDFAAVPIQHGGGTKTKLFDYISVGLPIVTTVKGAEGVDLVDGEHASITEAVDEAFLDRIEQLATASEQRAEYATALRSLADQLTWERSVDRLAAFYDEDR